MGAKDSLPIPEPQVDLNDPIQAEYKNASLNADAGDQEFKHPCPYVYDGERDSAGEMTGFGELRYENGDEFEGDLKSGNFDGFGTYKKADGSRYEGEFVNSKRHGNGTYHYSTGEMYEGEWFNGRKHGVGTFTFKNGNKYSGGWNHGTMNGRGLYSYSNGNVYEGSMKNNRKDGFGKMTMYVSRTSSSGKTSVAKTMEVYEGMFRNDLRHGRGKYRYANGEYYEGEFEKEMKAGDGTYYFLNGDTMKGCWENGQLVSGAYSSQSLRKHLGTAPLDDSSDSIDLSQPRRNTRSGSTAPFDENSPPQVELDVVYARIRRKPSNPVHQLQKPSRGDGSPNRSHDSPQYFESPVPIHRIWSERASQKASWHSDNDLLTMSSSTDSTLRSDHNVVSPVRNASANSDRKRSVEGQAVMISSFLFEGFRNT